MISPRIKGIVQHLIADVSFRQSFVDDPAAVIADAGLADAERRAILRLRARLATVEGGELAADPSAQWP
ncbi:MAG: hypothetical protein ACRDIY_14995 [Chloroflexota bacterium]